MKILFLDEEKRRIEPHIEGLERHGHIVDHFRAVREAVSALETDRRGYDCFIVDVLMPVDNSLPEPSCRNYGGLQFYTYLRRSANPIHNVPIVFLTVVNNLWATSEVKTHEEGRPVPSISILRKPVDPLELIDSVEHLSIAYRRRANENAE